MRKDKTMKLYLSLMSLLFCAMVLQAQMVVKGLVLDEMGEPVPEVAVSVKAHKENTVYTDLEGRYTLTIPADQVSGGDVVVVCDNYGTLTEQTVSYQEGDSISLDLSFANVVEEVKVVAQVGYGAVAEKDLTGSVSLVTPEEMNEGPIVSAPQLIQGKVPGVSIVSGGGAPGSNSQIRIRGTGSMSLNSDPLIVIDGVPIISEALGGSQSVLNTLNPSDIETFSVLKDASATAIYGARSANGVIIITTKKGSKGKPRWTFNSSVALADPVGRVNMFGADEYREQMMGFATPSDIARMGTGTTDWQDEIFDQALSFNSSLGVGGAAFEGKLPYRASVGFTEDNGILLGNQLQRTTGRLSLTPSFLQNHLKVELNANGAYIENDFANTGAIGSAVVFDPTQNVYDADGSYFNWMDPLSGGLATLAPRNPLMMLYAEEDLSKIKRLTANAKIDYNFHFLPALTATLNVGMDNMMIDGEKYTTEDYEFIDVNQAQSASNYHNESENKLLDMYLTYDKKIGENQHLNIVAGYSYQEISTLAEKESYNYNKGSDIYDYFKPYDHRETEVMIGYFGRFNYSLYDKYLLTATFRADASSKLDPADRWGYFPSVALAWKMHKEAFMENLTAVNNLKLRVGYGQIGNINGLSNYVYLTRYTQSDNKAQYQIGDVFYPLYRPEAFNALQWEVGETYNLGLDYGFLNNRINGSVDVYKKITDNLIYEAYVDPFTNFSNRVKQNLGEIQNRGIEFILEVVPVETEDWVWSIGYNITYNKNEITKLTAIQETGDAINGGTGNKVQLFEEGAPAGAFYVYEQVYDQNGRPLEGVFVDRDGDGNITEGDRYLCGDREADTFMGLNTNVKYKNWDLAVVSRASFGNSVYDNMRSNNSYRNNFIGDSSLDNVHKEYLYSGFVAKTENTLKSDYWVKDASFFKVDNITVGYTLSSETVDNLRIRFYGSVQNVYTITDYQGIDPEIQSGIDKNSYPRPRTWMLGINVNF